MKAFIALFALVSVNSYAAPVKVIACTDGGDPDYVNVDIYKDGDRRFAAIEIETGDGDEYATDLVEIRKDEKNDYSVISYNQVKGSYPKLAKLSDGAASKTQGFSLSIGRNSMVGIARFARTPFGTSAAKIELQCANVKN